MRQPSSTVAGMRLQPSRRRRRASLSFSLAFALSSLLVADDALASERSRDRSEPGLSAVEDKPLLARRRTRDKRPRQKPDKPAETTAPAPSAPSAPAPSPAAQEELVNEATRRGPTRVEFDERLLQGQTNKANAIYLFQRRESALRTLVKKREHFHAEIDEALE